MLLTYHKILAAVLSLPIIWFAATGCLLVFSENIDRILNLQLMTAASRKDGHDKQAMDAYVKELQTRTPTYKYVLTEYPKSDSDTLQTLWRHQRSGDLWQLFMHPDTGELLGKRRLEDSFTHIITRWHRLHFFDTTTTYLVVNSFLVLLLAVIMLGFWHFGQAQFFRKPALSKHALAGILLATPLFIMAITGFLLLNFETQPLVRKWHTGNMIGVGSQLLWFWVTLLLPLFVLLSLLSWFKKHSDKP